MSKRDINKVVRLEGLDVDQKWEDGYEWGAFVERAFPNSEAYDLCQCINYNIGELMFANFADITCLQVGFNDGDDWHWKVTLASGRILVVVGGCDYTGWDCQSYGMCKEVEV